MVGWGLGSGPGSGFEALGGVGMEAGDRLLVRLMQVSAVVLVVGLCMAAVVLGWVAYALRGLSD